MILSNAPLHYPSAREWMWNYCIYLGPWTDPDTGINYDLGIHLDDYLGHSYAIVTGNEPGDYFSGDIERYERRSCYAEAYRRANELNLLN